MTQYKVGIIGCGSIFPMHSQSITRQHNAKLVAVCDIKEELAKEKAKLYNCAYYRDYQEMLAQEQLDVVHICTPHYLHAPMAIAAMEQGIHVLTEKPMAISVADAQRMLHTAEQHRVVLSVIFQNRFNPGSQLIKQTLESGQLGKVLASRLTLAWHRNNDYYSSSDWRGTWGKEGGGVIINQAIHTLDLACWFIDSEIEYVDANISNRLHNHIEVEDSAEGLIKYQSGAITCFQTVSYYGYDAPVELELYCEKGIAKMVSETAVITFYDGQQLQAAPDSQELIDYGGAKSYWGVSHIKQITDFYQSLEQGREPEVTAKDAIKTQELVCAIYESGRTRRKVFLAAGA